MAEEKKQAKSVKPTVGGGKEAKVGEHVTFLLVGLLILGAIVTALLNYIESLGLGTSGGFWGRLAFYFSRNIWPIWKILAVAISALSLAGIIYNARRLAAIDFEERQIYDPLPGHSVSEEITEPKNAKWERIMDYLNSDNPSDWQLAIIEADVMLGELLRAAGYSGESVGEMLKSVDENEFATINDAWEAHKVRNTIAHSGGDFQLNEREARRTIALFEKVFKEFEII